MNINANGTYYFKATDAAGNIGTNSITFTNIDNTAPVIELTGDNTTPLQKATLTASTEDDIDIFYSTNNISWRKFVGELEVISNGTYYFKATDAARNVGTNSITFTNIDNTAPVIQLKGNNITLLQKATITASTEDGIDIFYSTDNTSWSKYDGELEVTSNGTYHFKATDAAGNIGTNSITFTNIDNTAPIIALTGDNTTPLQKATLTASTEDGIDIFYSTDNGTWQEYDGELKVTSNGTYHFKATDAAGNIGTNSITFTNIDNTAPFLKKIEVGIPNASKQAIITFEASEELSVFEYSWNEGEWTALHSQTLSVSGNGTLALRMVDIVGNETLTETYAINPFNMQMSAIDVVFDGNRVVLDWSNDSTLVWADGFDVVIQMKEQRMSFAGMEIDGLEFCNLPSGLTDIMLKPNQSDVWTPCVEALNIQRNDEPIVITAESNGHAEYIFAFCHSTWEQEYLARHDGFNGWRGTGDSVSLAGKNVVNDLFFGSDDATMLILTDDNNGDAIFVDDIYTAFPEGMNKQARIENIDIILAGAGDDVIDLTSQQFEYVGGGVKVYGGDGNDVIWANNGENWLYGDAGNDSIIGASGNDVFVGGIGNDTQHGGGGDDIFCFCKDWGKDTVCQIDGGTVTLWFAEGTEKNWNKIAKVYRDGKNTVAVTGVDLDKIELRFGDDGSELYKTLCDAGAFERCCSQNIFERKDMLA